MFFIKVYFVSLNKCRIYPVRFDHAEKHPTFPSGRMIWQEAASCKENILVAERNELSASPHLFLQPTTRLQGIGSCSQVKGQPRDVLPLSGLSLSPTNQIHNSGSNYHRTIPVIPNVRGAPYEKEPPAKDVFK
ncbi:MAG: hypothetical protein WDM70_08965 [Nitrosomonadales bacterium]